ncbi:MAG: NAD-dependent epimerase/dehydratase family protein [Muribaculaceae bacterium]|nr:NAD-dependent epimerase/dehydratase family protein [Roseburia sp.]MCM1432291.1 NAD-dependent epimerase/dehydratase family protein [Muribaculaceae bacterium]MCM1494095.1 NAD-dependent epimerase/dehydratase family protein [Muribaculaceae bacterium]
MKKVLITGGTVFVSRYVAAYYVHKGCQVYVLNRNTRKQPEGVRLIEADRRDLGDRLQGMYFDVVFDMTAYTKEDVNTLLDALDSYGQYILLSSSAVYPEYAPQPFTEEETTGANRYWGDYGTNKIEAEAALLERDSDAYILRPPYLYGQGNNIYREAFVFDCAMQGRSFYLPGDGEMRLQFFHVEDLCRFMDRLLAEKPKQQIFNVGNRETLSVRDWVKLCYQAAGKEAEFVSVHGTEQRNYFCFYDYEYCLEVKRQSALMPETKPFQEGIAEAFAWYRNHAGEVKKKDYIEYIEQHLASDTGKDL